MTKVWLHLKRSYAKVQPPAAARSIFAPTCAVDGCDIEGWMFGSCQACYKYFCPSHLRHPCVELDDLEFTRAHQRVLFRSQDNALLPMVTESSPHILSAAAMLRPSHTAKLKLWNPLYWDNDHLNHGRLHNHAVVDWDDGQRWIARFRKHMPGEVTGLRKAVASIDYANNHKAAELLPGLVPKVWATPYPQYDFEYFFMEYKDGEPLLWNHSISAAEKQGVVEGIADYFIQVANSPLEGIGSFYIHSELGTPVLGPLLYGFNDLTYGGYPYGPFKTSQDAYSTLLNDILACIESGALYHDLADTIPAYLAYLDALDLVTGCTEMAREEPTYLCHGDLHHGNLLWDPEAKKITAVIDWELSCTVPFAEAFVAPEITRAWGSFLEPGGLREVEAQLADTLEQRGRSDLAGAVRNGRKYILLRNLLKLSGLSKFGSHNDQWRLRHAFLGDSAGPQYESMDDFVAAAMARHAHHPGVRKVEARVEAQKSKETQDAVST